MNSRETEGTAPSRGGRAGAVPVHGGRPRTRDGSQRSRHARIPASVVPRLAGLSKRAVLVYLAVAAHADRDGVCWPSRESVAAMTGLSEQSVKKGGSELVQAGLLAREQDGARRWLYRLDGGYEPPAGGYESDPPGGYESDPPKEQPNGTESYPLTRVTGRGTAHDPDGSLTPMPRRPLPTTGQIGFDGSEVVESVNWPNEVRKAWHEDWRAAHGVAPPATHAERFAGKVREVERAIAKQGADHEWPGWVTAARQAARSGQWDLVRFFPQAPRQSAPEVSRYERAMAVNEQLRRMGS